jgi:thioesterase domain-containing protein
MNARAHDDEALAKIQRLLHEQIPLTRAMAVRVAGRTAEGGVILEAPLEPNHNHLQTAFGGSLATLATLSGYVMLWLEVDDPNCHIVIRESRISFQRPVRGTLRAICRRPDEAALAEFRAAFARKDRARLELEAVIEEDGDAAVTFQATFVAIR